jgi:hypothetical protein
MIDQPVDAAVEPPGSEPALAPLPLATGEENDVAEAEQTGTSWREIVDNRVLLLSTLFFVTAALGIPFLWQSRAFTTTWKAILTIIVLAYTALLFWLFWLVLLWSYHRIVNAA